MQISKFSEKQNEQILELTHRVFVHSRGIVAKFLQCGIMYGSAVKSLIHIWDCGRDRYNDVNDK